MDKDKGTLYIVPTPIGNLEDITFRAVNTLKNVSLVAAEDTRKSAVLLSHYNISTPMLSYHKFNERMRIKQLLTKLEHGEDIAIISDAGTPGISDPAQIIIREAISAKITVCTLPGATAFLPALVSSGLNTAAFLFIGFLPVKAKDRDHLLYRIKSYPETLIFYESAQRLKKILEVLLKYFGNRKIALAKEISKLYESYYRTSLNEYHEIERKLVLKGEFTIICEGYTEQIPSESAILQHLSKLTDQGMKTSEAAAKTAADLKIPKNKVYKIALKSINKEPSTLS